MLEFERQTQLLALRQRMDRMSRAAGLEYCVPFLDEWVIEHAALPARERFGLLDTKKPVRRAAAGRFGTRYANLPSPASGCRSTAGSGRTGPGSAWRGISTRPGSGAAGVATSDWRARD